MRVLLISHTCQSRTEGQPKARELSKLPGVELRVVIPDCWKHYGQWRSAETPSREEFDCQVGKVRWPWTGPGQFYLHWYPELARILREFKPDVIDLWEEPWGLVSAHTVWLRNRLLPETKIISETEQNIDKRLPPPFEMFRRYTLRHADFAVGRNAEALQVLRGKGYVGPSAVVPNAVDAELFRPPEPQQRSKTRDELGLSGFVVGYAGRLVEEKGLSDLLEALSLCPASVSLLLIGSGPAKEQLLQRVAQLGIASRVRFLEAVPPAQLASILGALDVLVLASRTTGRWKEQFGRVIIEAHACGIPVIGSDSGAIPEVVGQGGLIVPERNPPALADAIKRLIDDPVGALAMGAIGRAAVEESFTWAKVAERMRRIYERASAGR